MGIPWSSPNLLPALTLCCRNPLRQNWRRFIRTILWLLSLFLISDKHLTLKNAETEACKDSARRKRARQASQFLAGSPQVPHKCKFFTQPCSHRTQVLPGPPAPTKGTSPSGILLVVLTPRLQWSCVEQEPVGLWGWATSSPLAQKTGCPASSGGGTGHRAAHCMTASGHWSRLDHSPNSALSSLCYQSDSRLRLR